MKVVCVHYTSDPLDKVYTAARQCYHKGFAPDIDVSSITREEKEGLVSHVLNSGHHSVLEHVSFTFGIEGVSRSLSHQLVRHRISSFSQQSQRYTGTGKKIEGNSLDEVQATCVIPPTILRNERALSCFMETIEAINKNFSILAQEENIPLEDARFILPNAWKTNIIYTANARSLIHFLEERLCTLAQWEIRHLAQEIHKITKVLFPEVFNHIGPKCSSLGYCPESPKRTCHKKPNKVDFFKRRENDEENC
jgi:thymidylate synthase (FAD)